MSKENMFFSEARLLTLQLESNEAQLANTFNIEEKEQLRNKITGIKRRIDELLDQYNAMNKTYFIKDKG